MNKIKSAVIIVKFIFVFLLLSAIISCKFRQRVPLIIHNAKIYTVDDNFTIAEAMAINDGKIIAIGTNDEILKQFESADQKNAEGKTIYPGFIDAHGHFTGFATDMWKCSLVGTASFDEVVTRIKEYSERAPMEWIYGRGWDQNDWPEKEYPDKKLLDELFPSRPVFLKRIDGHAALVNQRALDIAGITVNTEVSGGIVETKNGKLTGILIDKAMKLVDTIIPQINDSLATEYFSDAQRLCFAVGITGVHDCGISEHTIDLVEAAQKKGLLKMKIFAFLADSAEYYQRWIEKGPYKSDRLHVGGFKVYADGALGSRGACLLEDYSDKLGWKGFLLTDTSYFGNVARKLLHSKLQLCTHAIGDSGNRYVLQLYASVLKIKNDRRWRIEHAQVVNENDFHLFSDFSIIPSVQPTHATSDMYWAEERVGSSRIGNAYAYKRLLSANNWMPLGTDFPVEDISPFKTFFAAVIRKDAKDYPKGGYGVENALSRQEALKGMTIWAAKAAFEENDKGNLVPGKSADFIILDTDLLNCAEQAILNISVLATYINGEAVYKK